jgi:D-aminoacyl-tRNA deacylase
MRIAVINSRQDPAGVNIRRHLLELCKSDGWSLLRSHDLVFHEVEGRLIFQDRVDEGLSCDCIIFISRHASSHPVPALTVHVTGNYGEAELGGRARELPPAAPELMHAILQNLSRNAPEGYRVSYEVTHHGPTELATPSLFVEIGSTLTEWEDPDAGRAVAESILSAAITPTINFIGFGGTHYAVRQTAIAFRSRAAFGHIAPGRLACSIDAGLAEMMRDQSRAAAAYIDKKALSRSECSHIESILKAGGLPMLSESEILGIGDVEWGTYIQIRELAEEIAPGALVRIHALCGKGKPATVTIPKDLLEEAVKSDKAQFMKEISALPVVHLSRGSDEVLPTFIGFEENATQLVNDLITLCVKLLLISEGTVVLGNDLIIRRARFDPKKARDLGVPAGPLFGALAGGGEIEIAGQIIRPDMVQTYSVKKIPIPGLERYR